MQRSTEATRGGVGSNRFPRGPVWSFCEESGWGKWTGLQAGIQDLSKGLGGPREQITLVRVKGLLGKYGGGGGHWVRRVDRGRIIDGTKERIEGIGICLEAWELPRELEEGESLLGNIRGYQLISLAWS